MLDIQRNNLLEARHKVAKSLEKWFGMLPDFLPSDITHEKEILHLPSDFSEEAQTRLGLDMLA